MLLSAIPSDPGTLLLALFALFGLPLIIFSLVLFYAGYVRYDADQSLEALETDPVETENAPERGTQSAEALETDATVDDTAPDSDTES
ncbi:hypothetical protein [Natronobacterium texcoconense]|uniref:Uncharacterized protein n=1 Tax=Natronobacterium texcoconense TaxID=1095778 RepID=A0A1H1GKB0_NATTX|nr:hypothetical protein [Natronobacterium texcoconense]SDR13630.1 hypothetical protein SAMN04489842_2474 [Natronobacterium texcoconense]